MTTPAPLSQRQAVGQLAGPRYRPAAHDVIALADAAVKAHRGIGERIADHAETLAQNHAARDAAGGAVRPADGAAGAGAP